MNNKDIDKLEIAVNKTFNLYKSIRDILQTLNDADGLRGVSTITFEDWDRIIGVLAGVLEMFQLAEEEKEKFLPELEQVFFMLKKAEDEKENEKIEMDNGNIIHLDGC